jgi:hypothetical protein
MTCPAVLPTAPGTYVQGLTRAMFQLYIRTFEAGVGDHSSSTRDKQLNAPDCKVVKGGDALPTW